MQLNGGSRVCCVYCKCSKIPKMQQRNFVQFPFFSAFRSFSSLLFSVQFVAVYILWIVLHCFSFFYTFFRVTFNHAVALRHTAFIIIQNQIGTNGIRTCVFSLNYYYVLCVCCLLCGIQQSVPFHINWTMYERLRCEYE